MTSTHEPASKSKQIDPHHDTGANKKLMRMYTLSIELEVQTCQQKITPGFILYEVYAL